MADEDVNLNMLRNFIAIEFLYDCFRGFISNGHTRSSPSFDINFEFRHSEISSL